jgi:hypothetical protein
MTLKPRAITGIGVVQFFLAATFVVWLLFFPTAGDRFAWPVVPPLTAMFIGTAFIARTYLGFQLWRQKYWHNLRWQVWGNYGFLAAIFLATLWHADKMNWHTSFWMAHIWTIAYIVEPVMLPLLEPRGAGRNAPLPPELQAGPILATTRWLMAAILLIGVTIGGLLIINPAFINTRWPWPLDPFDARVMAAFPVLAAGWAAWVYFAEDWALAKLGVIGLGLHAASLFVVWVLTLGQYDQTRHNVVTYGAVLAVATVLLIATYVRQELASRRIANHSAAAQTARV